MKFTIPLQSEIVVYIQTKKGWPEKFCIYYAEKFWNNYQASGWRLSNGNQVKDWKACFNAQWQVLKYKEDIDFFNKCMAESKPSFSADKNIQYLNEVLSDYKINYDKFPEERYVAIYDYLKEKRAIHLTKQEINDILEIAAGNVVKGKIFCVRTFFDKIINNGLNFSNILK